MLRETTYTQTYMGKHIILPHKIHCSFDSVSKNHNETRFSHHVITYHNIITGQNDDRLFSGYTLTIITVVMSSIVLACF